MQGGMKVCMKKIIPFNISCSNLYKIDASLWITGRCDKRASIDFLSKHSLPNYQPSNNLMGRTFVFFFLRRRNILKISQYLNTDAKNMETTLLLLVVLILKASITVRPKNWSKKLLAIITQPVHKVPRTSPYGPILVEISRTI